jgi:hypothetical protein
MTKKYALSKNHKAAVINAAAAGANAQSAGENAKTALAVTMMETGAGRDMDKADPTNALGAIYATFLPAYLATYAKRYGDAPIASAIEANDIKVLGRKAEDSEKKELNKARNAAASMWKAALLIADPLPARGANETGETGETETEETGEGAKVSTPEGAAALLANGDLSDAAILLWAASPQGLPHVRKLAAKMMPQPK